MQPTASNASQSSEEWVRPEKKRYHRPSLRAVDSVKKGTGASYEGTTPDGTTGWSGSPLLTAAITVIS